jgi:predicted MPP superfamily phosphohydrolase
MLSKDELHMRVFALSDIHIDYRANARWIAALSIADYQDDVLILAGDASDTQSLLDWCLSILTKRFKKVMFVPGNHELWVIREDREKNSLQKLRTYEQSSNQSELPCSHFMPPASQSFRCSDGMTIPSESRARS